MKKYALLFGVLIPLSGILAACQIGDSKKEACARFAAHPEENVQINNSSVGVSFGMISKTKAIEKCRVALAEADDPSSKYHLSRALLSGKVTTQNLTEAKKLLTQSINEGYGFANFGVGYIAYTFEPRSGTLAAKHYQAAIPFGAKSGKMAVGYSLLFLPDTANRRAEGLSILETEAQNDPSIYLALASYHKTLPKNRTNWKQATDMLLEAQKNGVNQANLELAKIYWEEGSPLRNLSTARQMAKKSVDAGLTEGYEIWLKSYYFAKGNAKDHYSALIVARNGSKAGNVYSAYITGHMLYHGQGTDKNTLEAEKHLKFAAQNGSKNAKKLLGRVKYRANQLRNMPSGNPQNCVKSRMSSYDKNIINYRNGCNTALNTLICSRHVTTELFSLFDGKNRERCRRKQVGAGQYIDNFYGADENSSLARKAISNTNVKIGVCHPPMQPHFNGRKVVCKES